MIKVACKDFTKPIYIIKKIDWKIDTKRAKWFTLSKSYIKLLRHTSQAHTKIRVLQTHKQYNESKST